MADDTVTMGEGGEENLRSCPYCGATVDGRSHRCRECCGHTGIAWGTVHKEHWLFLFASILIAVACISSWNGRSPEGLIGRPMTGLDTLRGSFMFALALYGIVTCFFNILNRRMIVWPFFLNALLALWVGLEGGLRNVGGPAWKAWRALENQKMLDQFLGMLRAIPPGLFLLSIAGLLVMVKLVGGILAAAGKGKAAPPPKSGARRRRTGEAASTGGADPAADGSGEPGANV